MPCHSVRHVKVTNMWCFNSFLLWICLPWCPIGFRSMLVFCTHRISTFQGSFFLFLVSFMFIVLLVEKCDFVPMNMILWRSVLGGGFLIGCHSFFAMMEHSLNFFAHLLVVNNTPLALLDYMMFDILLLPSGSYDNQTCTYFSFFSCTYAGLGNGSFAG